MTWVQDGVFAAGGESLASTWREFAAQTGVTAVLHLRPSAPAAFAGPAPGAFLWIEDDEESEALPSVRWMAGEFIADCLAQGRRVLLHGARGRHRTRWCYVAYRILAGSTPEAALRRAAQPPWMAPYRTDEVRWRQFAGWARNRPATHTTALAAGDRSP